MEVWSLLQCFWNQSVVHSCYLDCFAETGPKYLPDISLKHLTKLLIVKLFVISEFENVEMLNVCKYMLWYEQMIMFKGLYSNFTWPWLINRSVVNGDQTEEDKRRSVEVCSLQASALIFVLKWPGIARKLTTKEASTAASSATSARLTRANGHKDTKRWKCRNVARICMYDSFV